MSEKPSPALKAARKRLGTLSRLPAVSWHKARRRLGGLLGLHSLHRGARSPTAEATPPIAIPLGHDWPSPASAPGLLAQWEAYSDSLQHTSDQPGQQQPPATTAATTGRGDSTTDEHHVDEDSDHYDTASHSHVAAAAAALRSAMAYYAKHWYKYRLNDEDLDIILHSGIYSGVDDFCQNQIRVETFGARSTYNNHIITHGYVPRRDSSGSVGEAWGVHEGKRRADAWANGGPGGDEDEEHVSFCVGL